MAWLWSSWEEFVEMVVPTSVDSPGLLVLAERGSWFETEQRLFEALENLRRALRSLNELGFQGSNDTLPPDDPTVIDEAAKFVVDLIHAGEKLLFYHKRLAKSDSAYGFLHSNDLYEHWERYNATGRLAREIDQLVEDTAELLAGYQEMVAEDDRFLVQNLKLPDELEVDFRLARNLFSLGFDEVGVLIAGRGLEGVLRRIGAMRKITLVVKNKTIPVAEADVYDMIETMYRVRWRATGARLLMPETRALLHYLRALRNESAHAGPHRRRTTPGPRETAALVAQTANQLWKEITNTRARLDPTTVNKNW